MLQNILLKAFWFDKSLSWAFEEPIAVAKLATEEPIEEKILALSFFLDLEEAILPNRELAALIIAAIIAGAILFIFYLLLFFLLFSSMTLCVTFSINIKYNIEKANYCSTEFVLVCFFPVFNA